MPPDARPFRTDSAPTWHTPSMRCPTCRRDAARSLRLTGTPRVGPFCPTCGGTMPRPRPMGWWWTWAVVFSLGAGFFVPMFVVAWLSPGRRWPWVEFVLAVVASVASGWYWVAADRWQVRMVLAGAVVWEVYLVAGRRERLRRMRIFRVAPE